MNNTTLFPWAVCREKERNLKGQLKYADRKGYRCAVIIGDNELASGQCQVKNLLESTQESVAFDELSDVIRKSIR